MVVKYSGKGTVYKERRVCRQANPLTHKTQLVLTDHPGQFKALFFEFAYFHILDHRVGS